MAFTGDVRAWLTSLLGCFNGVTHNGKDLVCSKIDGASVTVSRPVHSYTIPANTNKNWFRIAQSSVGQLHPMHCLFLLRAKNTDSIENYQCWLVDCQVYGRHCGLRPFGSANAPISSIRVLYENTVGNVTDNNLTYIDVYVNVKNTKPTEIEIEEVYNEGMIFAANGSLSVSTIPSGYENRNMGINQAGILNSEMASYAQRSYLNFYNFSTDTVLNSYRYGHCLTLLNCTGTITLTLPALNIANTAMYMVKNSGTGIVTLHPVDSTVSIEGETGDLTLQPGEYIQLSVCQTNKVYTVVVDGRWKSKKIDAASANYVKGLSISGKTITVTKGDDTTATLTTQDTVYTHPTTSGNKHIPSGGSSGQILRWSADGTAVWGNDNNTTYSAATSSAAGLMSATDKSNLDTLVAANVSDGGSSSVFANL